MMFKKIMLWTVYVVVVGLLIFGAVNRTSAKIGDDNFGERNISSSRQSFSGGQGNGQGGNGSDEQGGRGAVNSSGSEQATLSEGEDHDWTTLSGTITSFSTEDLQIEISGSNEDMIEVAGQAWRLVQELGYFPEEGNEVTVEGFYENGEFEVSTILDLSTGQIFLLREDSGRPLWSGGGRK